MLLATGLRRSELLALRWQDLNLEQATLLVCRALEKTHAHGLQFKAPKTRKTRVIAIPGVAVETLLAHRNEQNLAKIKCGVDWEENDLIFPFVTQVNKLGRRRGGGLWDPVHFSRAFRRLAQRAGVGNIGPHTLRHTAATDMLRQGLHPKVVSDRLGHSTTRMTLDVYSHVLPAFQTDAAARVDTSLRQAMRQHLVSICPENDLGLKEKTRKKPCVTMDSDGGRERSRTSDLYSVNVALYR